MFNNTDKVTIKKARQIRRKAESMWSDFFDLIEHDQSGSDRTSSQFFHAAVIPSVEKLVEHCLSALEHLPDFPEAVEESQHILKIIGMPAYLASNSQAISDLISKFNLSARFFDLVRNRIRRNS